MRLFCFGYGYSAESLARRLSPRDVVAAGTRTSLPETPSRASNSWPTRAMRASADVRRLLAGTTHLLVSIPPDLEGDVVLRHYRDDIAALPDLAWVGYLSTVGVYGDHKGAWVDEETPTRPTSERSLRRLQAEQAWLALPQRDRPAGRDLQAVGHLRAGTQRHRQSQGRHSAAHRQAGPGVQSHPCRRHRAGIGGGHRQGCRAFASTTSAMTSRRRRRMWWPMPPSCSACPFRRCSPSRRRASRGMAASFWAESKRVRNARIREDLGVELLYPTYREGLRALAGS